MTHTPTHNQYTMQDPTKQYPKPTPPKELQPEPGWTDATEPKPDHGEETYEGRERLKGRKALVTGGDSGIGRATAIAFAREGADIVMNYLPEEETDAQEVVELIKQTGQKVVTCPGDISDEQFCRQLVDTTIEELGGLDIIANIAGRQVSQKSIEDISTEQFDETFRVNLYSMFWICKFALPQLAAGASIINTASIQAYDASPTLLDYAATKAAIVAFTKGLAKQLADKGIRVNAVAPGPIWTPLQPSQGQPPEKLPDFGKDTPLGRPGQPAEVAPLFVFLASQESSYVTAETFGVTGGRHLP